MAPVPPFVEVADTELFNVPGMVPVTFTEKVQPPLATRVAPDRLTLVDPAIAVIVPPPQVPVRPSGVATAIPRGKASVKATPVRLSAALGLVMVNDSDVLPLMEIAAAPKVFVIEGGPSTVIEAVPGVLFVPALAELTVTVLFLTPIVVPVMLTENLQLALPASVAPVNETEVAPGRPPIVPPGQEPFTIVGVETTVPVGSMSVIAMPVTGTVLGFEIVKVRIAVPPSAIVPAEKAFPMEGGSRTVRPAVPFTPAP